MHEIRRISCISQMSQGPMVLFFLYIQPELKRPPCNIRPKATFCGYGSTFYLSIKTTWIHKLKYCLALNNRKPGGTSWELGSTFLIWLINIYRKMSQNENNMRQYISLKDVILNIFGLVLRGLVDVSLCSETTCHVRPLFYGRRGGLTQQVLLYI